MFLLGFGFIYEILVVLFLRLRKGKMVKMLCYDVGVVFLLLLVKIWFRCSKIGFLINNIADFVGFVSMLLLRSNLG